MHDHNMWNYLFFRLYLSRKPWSEYTAQESFVWEMVRVLVPNPMIHVAAATQ